MADVYAETVQDHVAWHPGGAHRFLTPPELRGMQLYCRRPTSATPSAQMEASRFAEVTVSARTRKKVSAALAHCTLAGDRTICKVGTGEVVAICRAQNDSETQGCLRDFITALDDNPADVSRPNPQDWCTHLVQHDSTGARCRGFAAAVGHHAPATTYRWRTTFRLDSNVRVVDDHRAIKSARTVNTSRRPKVAASTHASQQLWLAS